MESSTNKPAKQQIMETIGQLQHAAEQLAIGFKRAVELDRAEQADAMGEASAALIEMLGSRVERNRDAFAVFANDVQQNAALVSPKVPQSGSSDGRCLSRKKGGTDGSKNDRD